MRPPKFWYRPSGAAAVALSPLTLVWRGGGAARKIFAQNYRGKKPVICIGNLVAGGAGKTPTAIAIAELLLAEGKKPAFVSRGYGGMATGPLRVNPRQNSILETGDEALLLAQVAPVWIGQDRVATIQQAEDYASHILLDDGLQNPNIKPHLSFLVIDADAGIGNGHLIPSGPLRETLPAALAKVGAVILIGLEDKHNIAGQVPVPVLRASLVPDTESIKKDQKFFAFAGIGRPEKFYATCRAAGLELIGTRDYPDHHPFTERNVAFLRHKAQQTGAALITTEKDMVRLPVYFQALVKALPVKIVFEAPDAVLRLINPLK